MSKAHAADSDSTVRETQAARIDPLEAWPIGNPKGRPKGSRNKLSEEFFGISVMYGKLSASQR
jgi:hypothetical protein